MTFQCSWCPTERTAVAKLPMPEWKKGSSRDLYVCEDHQEWAEDHNWYVETLDGLPIGVDALMKRIDRKHQLLRGSLELKYKPN